MANNQEIINIINIPKSTVYDWKNRTILDWRHGLYNILKTLSVDELTKLKAYIMNKEDLKNLPKEEVMDFIKVTLNYSEIEKHLRHTDKNTFKDEHKRFEMSGYESKPGECTTSNLDILNEFAYLGIYDYTTYLFLDFYKGTPTLYYQYWEGENNIEDTFDGYGTIEIIYEIFQRTIFSNKKTRRRE